ncbi:hypothetical protein [Sphingobium tyrosinilyticum]
MANGGIDRSNLAPGEVDRALLLRVDPDGSAPQLLDALAGTDTEGIGIFIFGSFGRPLALRRGRHRHRRGRAASARRPSGWTQIATDESWT